MLAASIRSITIIEFSRLREMILNDDDTFAACFDSSFSLIHAIHCVHFFPTLSIFFFFIQEKFNQTLRQRNEYIVSAKERAVLRLPSVMILPLLNYCFNERGTLMLCLTAIWIWYLLKRREVNWLHQENHEPNQRSTKNTHFDSTNGKRYTTFC